MLQYLRDRLLDHKHYIHEHGEDMPGIRDWRWTLSTPPAKAGHKRTLG